MRNIAIGADHGGFELKQTLVSHLATRGFDVADCGTTSTEPVDYPAIAVEVARQVASGQSSAGVMVDGAGIGSSMVANKVPGVRAALCYDVSSARNSREHNDANVLTLGASLIGPGLAKQILDVFLDSECTAERHLRRVSMIRQIEEGARVEGEAACSCLASHAEGASATEDALARLSGDDLQRVADRIAAMLPAGGSGDPSSSCGFCRPCTAIDPQDMREFVRMGADRIVHRGNGQGVPEDVARLIDHTLLRPDATCEQIEKLCDEAAQFGFASVCVNPCYVKTCAARLRGSSVRVCTVVGFPLGANTSDTKALETRRAIREGAKEIDMVINIGAIKSGDDGRVYQDIRRVVEACMDGGALCKVILETALLTDDEKARACAAARRAGADYVKTSTGFGPGGATPEDVALMAASVKGTKMGVKASGGIRDFESARQMIRAGATRLGASAGIRIMKEAKGVTESA